MQFCSQCKNLYPTDMQFCPKHGTRLESESELAPGMVIREKYEILEEIGTGGMGRVFRVKDLDFAYGRNQSAMKIPSAQFATDPDFVRRFRDEAAKARVLNHPNVVRIEHIDRTESGLPFIVMELVPGRSLRAWMEAGIHPREACAITREIAVALDAAHSAGLIHCDIKPENVLSVGKDSPLPLKVTDFGLAKTTKALLDKVTRVDHQTTWGGNLVVGTPDYMSPEQSQGRVNIGPPSDIYSLGVVLFEMLTGQLPTIERDSAAAARPAGDRRFSAILARQPDLPPALSRLVSEMLDGLPERRPTAASVVASLDALLHGPAVEHPAPPPRVTTVEPITVEPATLPPVQAPSNPQRPDTISEPQWIRTPAPIPASAPAPVRSFASNPVLVPTNPPLPDPPRRSKPLLWIGALVAVLVIAGIAWYASSRPKPAPPPSGPDPVFALDPTPDPTPKPAVQPADPTPAPVSDDRPAPASPASTQQEAPDLGLWLNNSIKASQGPYVEDMRPYYAGTVSPYYTIPTAQWADIARDKQAYFDRFPQIHYTLANWRVLTGLDGSKAIEFDVSYSALRKDGHMATGVSHQWESLQLDNGVWKITGIRDRSAMETLPASR